MVIRLNKHLADLGIASRRQADKLIAAGKVKVNGEVAKLGEKIDPEYDKIEVADDVLASQKELVYILLHKPTGYVTSSKKTKTEPKIVMDLVKAKNFYFREGAGGKRIPPEQGELPKVREDPLGDKGGFGDSIKTRIFPVGRLDKETSGLLILTNDGVLAYRLTHPSLECEKEYEVSLSAPLTEERVRKVEEGMRLDHHKTKPTNVEKLGVRRARIILREGKNRQVRRVFGKVGCEVKTLKRVRIKDLWLDENLKPGQWRYLTKQEVGKIHQVD